MAKPDARLELSRARQRTGTLEINPSAILRYAAVLHGDSQPPSLSSAPVLVLPALFQPILTNPLLAVQTGLAYQATLASTLPELRGALTGAVLIEATLASTTEAPIHQFEAGYDINVFRGPSHASAGDWDQSARLSHGVASDWQPSARQHVSRGNDWQEAAPLAEGVTEHSERPPRLDAQYQAVFDEGQALGRQLGQWHENLAPGHAVNRSLWVEGEAVGRWQLGGYLAEAAGGFVLPHQRQPHLVIKPRYPTVPWQLESAQADLAIPRAIITTLGSDFQPGQSANGIWVSGGHQGISARVLRQGTAGERQAQSITHPLVCDVVAARAQGVVALANTLPKRTMSIELPLSADTGLILPGALLAVDGWRGYNRGVRVTAALQNRAMQVRQQLSVERFV